MALSVCLARLEDFVKHVLWDIQFPMKGDAFSVTVADSASRIVPIFVSVVSSLKS